MKDTKTYYTPESLNKAIESIKDLKSIVVKAQDYEMAAKLRDFEKYYLNKIEEDKNRKI
jgi:hypothetical protein